MTQRTVFAVGILTVVTIFVIAAFGWSSWTGNAQRSQRQRTDARARQDNAQSNTPDTSRDVLIAANRAPQAAKFGEGTWLNSDALSLESLRGKVVLVDFWTFGCYNCRNTLPTVKRFDQTYRNKGLTIVGVHAPESDYEKGIDNVREAVQRLGVKYPVVTDNDYNTWRAYNIQAWPTIVILDKQGRIRYTHIGEGDYEQQERIIKTLLAEEAGASNSTGANQTEIITNSNEGKELAMNDRVTKTDAEWRQELTAEQYRVMREQGTERAFTGEYNDNHEQGTYYCAACDNALFKSDAKFDSGTGWPSFYAPVFTGNVRENVDVSLGMKRTEVVCARCGGHLGHVFDDGPKPTGLRYCMNSVALNFEKK